MSLYCDLNIPANNLTIDQRVALLSRASQLGYDAVAWNYTVSLPMKEEVDIDEKIPLVGGKLPKLGLEKEGGRVMRFVPDRRALSGTSPAEYRRVTVLIKSTKDVHYMRTSLFTKMVGAVDLLAVKVGDVKLFKQAINDMDVDLIEWDMSRAPPNLQPVKTKRQMKARSIFFDVPYANGLKERNRGFWLSNAMQLRHASKTHIILSSGISSPKLLRRPEDVVNLACLIGCTPLTGRLAISNNCFAALAHGETRLKTCYGAASVDTLEDQLLQPMASWKLSKDLVPEEHGQDGDSSGGDGDDGCSKRVRLAGSKRVKLASTPK